VPNQPSHPDPDDARAGGPGDESERTGGLPLAIVARIVPRPRTALSVEAVRWLLHRAGGMWGRHGGLPAPLSPAFLDRVDPDEPVAVLRAHLEPADLGGDGPADAVVALCSFAPREPGGERLVHELVCRPDDYVRVAHGTTLLADWSRDEFQRLQRIEARREDMPAPPEELPEGTRGVVQADGAVRVVEGGEG
jgi:hypothetical protein